VGIILLLRGTDMKWRLMSFLAAISVLVSACAVALWVRSCWVGDWLSIPSHAHYGGIGVSRGSVLLRVLSDPPGGFDHETGSARWLEEELAVMQGRPSVVYWEFLGFGFCQGHVVYYSGSAFTVGVTVVWFPLWAVIAIALPWQVVWLRCAYVRRVLRLRRRQGLCETCGYDLRASPGVCPECGSEQVCRWSGLMGQGSIRTDSGRRFDMQHDRSHPDAAGHEDGSQ